MRNHQNAPQTEPLAATGHSPAARLQQGGGLCPRGTHGRRQPEEHSCQYRERRRESQHTPIHAEIQEDLILLRADKGHKHPAYRERQEQSTNRASDRKQKAFGEQFANHSPTRRSKGPADGDLPLSCTGAGEHQVRQVGACNEQHQSGDSEQQPKRRL